MGPGHPPAHRAKGNGPTARLAQRRAQRSTRAVARGRTAGTSVNKSDLALIHGWGLGSGVWHTCAGQLESVARIHHIDLPGYGDTPDHGETFIEAAQSALEALPDGVTLCGWSLGSQLAMQAAKTAIAHHEDMVARLRARFDRLYQFIQIAERLCFVSQRR